MTEKTCHKCLENVKVHVTCFKCSSVYHPKCLLKAPMAYVNEMGQAFCCLNSKYNTFENRLESQENKTERYNEEGGCGSDGLECNGLKQEKYEKDENTCDLTFSKEEVEDGNGDGVEFVCSFCEMKFFEEKPYRQHIELCENNNLQLNKTRDAAVKFRKIYKCNKCSYKSKQPSRMKTHLKIHSRILQKNSKQEQLYKCTYCNYTTYQKNYLKEHILTHRSQKPFGCGTCGFATVYEKTFIRHITLNHSNPQIDVACSFCEMKFFEEKSYRRHLQLCERNNLQLNKILDATLSKYPYKCDICSHTARTPSLMQNHLSTHSDKKPFKCTFKNCTCPQSQSEHCNCNLCEYRTTNKGYLKKHIFRKHTKENKLFKCNDCQYSTYQKHSLREHTLVIHQGQKPFVCDICGFATGYKRTFNVHIASKHSNSPIDIEKKCYKQHRKLSGRNDLRLKKIPGVTISKNQYKCDLCAFTAMIPSQMWNHLNIHFYKKSIKCTFKKCTCPQSQSKHCDCNVCEYRTDNKNCLRRHILREHSKEEQLYKCNDCPYSYHQKRSLRNHILQTHQGKKPFVCDACGFTTFYKRNLHCHIVSRHGKPEINVCSLCKMTFFEQEFYRQHINLCKANN